jgi:hypothetical protein
MIEIIGTLIKEIAVFEGDQKSRERKLTDLFELLTIQFLDLSSYVRSNSAAVF